MLRTTLVQYIRQQEKMNPNATGMFTNLMYEILVAAKFVSLEVNKAGIGENIFGLTGETNIHGEEVQKLDRYANETFIKTVGNSGCVCAITSEESEKPVIIDPEMAGNYIFMMDPAAPELFLTGDQQALILNQDGTVNSAANPAPQGSIISVFLSGQGAVSPPVESGRPASVRPLSQVVSFPTAEIGGQEANVFFLGLAPGYVGLSQGNVGVPTGPTMSARLQPSRAPAWPLSSCACLRQTRIARRKHDQTGQQATDRRHLRPSHAGRTPFPNGR